MCEADDDDSHVNYVEVRILSLNPSEYLQVLVACREDDRKDKHNFSASYSSFIP